MKPNHVGEYEQSTIMYIYKNVKELFWLLTFYKYLIFNNLKYFFLYNIFFSIYQIPLKYNKFAWKENIPFSCASVADSSLFVGSAFPSSPWHRGRLRAPTWCQPDLTHKAQR